MDKQKYQAAMDLLKNPDTAPQGLVMLNDLVNVDSEVYVANQQKIKDSEATLTTLRDTNAQLALRITSPVDMSKADPEPETDEQIFDRLFTQTLDAKEGA